MANCNPGFMPKLLGCVSEAVSESECGKVTYSCAALSLAVTLLIILVLLAILSGIYQACLYICDVKLTGDVQNQPKSKRE